MTNGVGSNFAGFLLLSVQVNSWIVDGFAIISNTASKALADPYLFGNSSSRIEPLFEGQYGGVQVLILSRSCCM
jgi:hypothetical protein